MIATPTVTSAPQAVDENAPLMRRFGAMLYEGVLLFGVSFITEYLFDTLTQSRHALMYRHARELWLFLVYGCYFVYFWTHGGQTLAMKTWHIRLVSREGGAVPLAVAMLRYCACWMVPVAALSLAKSVGLSAPLEAFVLGLALVVPPFAMLILPSKQFIYDQFIGTRLISATRLEAHKSSAADLA